MWLDSKAVNCPQKWGNFRLSTKEWCRHFFSGSSGWSILKPPPPFYYRSSPHCRAERPCGAGKRQKEATLEPQGAFQEDEDRGRKS